MSSVKDRIRNLQQSTNVQTSKSVAERAKAAERVSESHDDQPQSLSQLRKRFDSTVTNESSSGLGARVARFDSDTSQSLKDRVRRLESGASDTGSLAARASAFERPGSAVKDTAEQFSEQETTPDEDNFALHKARAMFEAGSKDSSIETALSKLKIASENGRHNVHSDESAKISAATPSQPKSPSPTTGSQDAVVDGLSSRAAMFERTESEPQAKSKGMQPTQRDPPKSLPAIPPRQRDERSETSNATTSKVTDEKSLRDELREVKRANEELVSMLLELTSAFRRLEGSRDELQKRISELEHK